MKRIYLWALLALIMGIMACSDNAAIDTPEPNNPGAEGDVNLTVSIKLPGTDAVPYSQIALSDELAIDSVMAFAFVEKSGEFIFNKMYPFSKQDNGSGGIIIAGTTISLPITVKNTNSDMKFFFVANSGGITSLRNLTPGLATETDFLKALTNTTFQGMKNRNDQNVSPLLMTTDSVRITSTELQAENPTIDNLEFKRIVSRIDIRNRERTLAIDSVQFLNTPRQSLIFNKKRSNNSWQFAENGTAVSRSNFPIVRIQDDLRYPPKQAGSPTETVDSVHLKSLFFPYEGEIVDPNAVTANTSIRVWGRLNPKAGDNTSGTEVIYNLNLAEGKKPNDDTPVQLLRNNRYILLIENALAHEITYNFTVNEWIEDDDTVKHIMDPEIGLQYNGTKLFELEANKAGGSYTIDVNSPTDWDIQIGYVDGDGWLTPSTPQTYSDIPNYFTLTAEENWGEARKAIVIVRSKVSITAEETQFTVTQGSVNPLAKFAKANLRTDYTIGDDLTAQTAGNISDSRVVGALFQWGRNIPFDNASLTNDQKIQGTLNVDHLEVGSNKFILGNNTEGNSNRYNWMSEGKLNDTWLNISNQTPVAIKGDPCPAGYRLPTVKEIAMIIPINNTVGSYETNASHGSDYASEATAAFYYMSEDASSKVSIENTTPAIYITNGNSILPQYAYAIKRKGLDHSYAMRWTYKGSIIETGAINSENPAFLTIESVPTTEIDINVINKSTFWTTSINSGNYVVRYFPAAGLRNWSSGAANSQGNSGFYWASNASSTTNAWAASFNTGNVYLFAHYRSYGFSIRCVTND